YLRDVQRVTIGAGKRRIELRLKRWIDPAKWGWYSGDPHIHAGGGRHYEHPTEGGAPQTMIPQGGGGGLLVGRLVALGPTLVFSKAVLHRPCDESGGIPRTSRIAGRQSYESETEPDTEGR